MARILNIKKGKNILQIGNGLYVAKIQNGKLCYINNAEFKEAEHPRDKTGKFSSKGKTEEHYEEVKSSVIEISGKEVEEAGGFIEYYNKNLKGKTVKNPVLGEIHFYARHAKETINKNKTTPENLKFIAGIYKMLETSEEVEEEELYKPRKDDIKKFYKVSGYITIAGEKPRKVSVKIAEDMNGKKYYTLDARTEEQKNSLSTDTSLEAGLSKGKQVSNLAYTYNVSQLYKDVNIFFE